MGIILPVSTVKFEVKQLNSLYPYRLLSCLALCPVRYHTVIQCIKLMQATFIRTSAPRPKFSEWPYSHRTPSINRLSPFRLLAEEPGLQDVIYFRSKQIRLSTLLLSEIDRKNKTSVFITLVPRKLYCHAFHVQFSTPHLLHSWKWNEVWIRRLNETNIWIQRCRKRWSNWGCYMKSVQMFHIDQSAVTNMEQSCSFTSKLTGCNYCFKLEKTERRRLLLFRLVSRQSILSLGCYHPFPLTLKRNAKLTDTKYLFINKNQIVLNGFLGRTLSLIAQPID